MKLRSLSILVLLSLGILSCGKSVDLTGGSSSAQEDTAGILVVEPQGSQCSDNTRIQWNFIQPSETHPVVDLLFVVDTSASLLPKRALIAATIPAFIAQLAPSTDYRVAVMLAHGGASSYSGRLYADATSPLVLNSRTMTVPVIQANLAKTLARPAFDTDEAGGEMMMYSLLKSIEPAHFAAIQAQGFYRPEAALSVVFVTDENDACYRPELNGFTSFPDFVASPTGTEAIAYDRYCLNRDGSLRVSPQTVFEALRRAKEGRAISLGAIAHIDAQTVPRAPYVEHAIGHGIIELVSMTPNHALIDVTSTDYSHGLTELGSVVEAQLHLNTSFHIKDARAVDESTFRVDVDGRAVPFKFEQGLDNILLNSRDAGAAGSQVAISACPHL